MPTDTTDITIEILRRIQAEQTAQRQDTRRLQESFVDVVRLIQRMDQRISDMKSDLETMFKMELIGQHAHQQTRIEQLLDDRLALMEERFNERLSRIEAKLPA